MYKYASEYTFSKPFPAHIFIFLCACARHWPMILSILSMSYTSMEAIASSSIAKKLSEGLLGLKRGLSKCKVGKQSCLGLIRAFFSYTTATKPHSLCLAPAGEPSVRFIPNISTQIGCHLVRLIGKKVRLK